MAKSLMIILNLQKHKLEQKAKNDTMNNPAHYNNFPGFNVLILVL